MSVLSELQEQEREQTISELSTSLTAIDEQLGALTSTVQKVVEAQNRNTETVRELTSSQESGASSQSIASVQKMLAELTATIVEIGETLTRSEAVKLPDGRSVSRSTLSAHAMMTKVVSEITDLRSETERLAKEVHGKARVHVDSEKVAEFVAGKLGTQIDKLVEASTERVDQVLAAHEDRLAGLGEARVSEITRAAHEATKALERAEKVASGLQGALTWSGVGKVALAALPVALVLLAAAVLLGVGGHVLGVEPLFGWAWASFSAAEVWWVKLLIAVATLGGASALGWVVYKLGKRLSDIYRGW